MSTYQAKELLFWILIKQVTENLCWPPIESLAYPKTWRRRTKPKKHQKIIMQWQECEYSHRFQTKDFNPDNHWYMILHIKKGYPCAIIKSRTHNLLSELFSRFCCTKLLLGLILIRQLYSSHPYLVYCHVIKPRLDIFSKDTLELYRELFAIPTILEQFKLFWLIF